MDDIFSQLSRLTGGNNSSESSGYATDDESLFAYDDLISPKIKPEKSESERKSIVVIDDDYSSLDLLRVYLCRDYDYHDFDNAKKAIFWLNHNVPDLILLDSYLTVISSKRMVEIIRSYKELAGVPIFYLCDPVEQGAVDLKLPEGVVGSICRPVSRQDLEMALRFAGIVA